MLRLAKLGFAFCAVVAVVVTLTGAQSPSGRPAFERFEAHLTMVEEGPLIHMTREEYDAYVVRLHERFPDSTLSTTDSR